MIFTLIYLIDVLFKIYVFIIIAQVAVSWLIAFEVINTNNQQARNLVELLNKATEPVYKPIRKYIPPIGGIDITPIIVLIGLQILKHIIIGLLLHV